MGLSSGPSGVRGIRRPLSPRIHPRPAGHRRPHRVQALAPLGRPGCLRLRAGVGRLTSVTEPGTPGERPGRRSGGSPRDQVNLGRGLLLVAVAVVLGVLLLAVGSRPPAVTAGSTAPPLPLGSTTTTVPASTTSAPTTTTAPATTTTTHHSSGHAGGHATSTTTSTVPHSSVAVLVANGTTVNNAAANYSQALSAQGWNTLPPVDTTSTVAASAVYYAQGQQAAAQEVAQTLGLTASAVKPLTTSVPVSSTTGADVVVVIGPDLANKTPSTSASNGST